jgi:dihydrofolate reductase
MPRLSIIAAVARNGIIGRDGGLPWRLSSDLKRFKRLTMGNTMIMGRKTFESIGRLLPGRHTVVLTRQVDWTFAGATVCASLPTALSLEHLAGDEVFVIGGAQLYETALPIADRLYLTRVENDVDGDTRFPEWNEADWRIVEQEFVEADERNEYDPTFAVYDRIVG